MYSYITYLISKTRIFHLFRIDSQGRKSIVYFLGCISGFCYYINKLLISNCKSYLIHIILEYIYAQALSTNNLEDIISIPMLFD